MKTDRGKWLFYIGLSVLAAAWIGGMCWLNVKLIQLACGCSQ